MIYEYNNLTGLPAPLVDVSQGRNFCIRVNLVYGSSEKVLNL